MFPSRMLRVKPHRYLHATNEERRYRSKRTLDYVLNCHNFLVMNYEKISISHAMKPVFFLGLCDDLGCVDNVVR